MAQTTLEAIKGGGGSIKVGTTGTINALMSRELQSVKVPPPLNNVTIDTKPKAKVQIDETTASCSGGTTTATNEKETGGGPRKPKPHHHARTASRNPFLRCDSVDVNGTPIKKKNEKKGVSCIVEIVDVKCGVPDKAWANPITNKFKKLSFSKLSV